METNEATVYQQGKDDRNHFFGDKNNPHSGRVLAGTVVLAVGGMLLARAMGADIPHWVFSWPMIVLAAGLYSGAKRNFRIDSWLVAVAVGAVFLLMRINPELEARDFMWPVIIISIGVIMIFRPKKEKQEKWSRIKK